MAEVRTDFTARLTEVEKAYDKLFRQNAKLIEQNKKLAQGHRQAAQAHKSHNSAAMHGTMQLVSAYMMVRMGISEIIRLHETWLRNIHRISTETEKASNELIAFAALQEGGTKAKRVQAAANLAMQYGVSDRGEAFNTIQALQSARGGDIQAGMASARTVFAATQVGIPAERGRELEVLGASQGAAPGQFIRQAFVAGQLSARTPETLAGAAPGLKFFEDKDFGFAAAAVLAGSLPEEQLRTYTKRGGQALSAVGPVQAGLKKRGITVSGQEEALGELARLGIETPAELKAFGVTELRQIEALASLVPNFEEVKRVSAEIKRQATPGLLARQRAGVEEELPGTTITREKDILRSMYKDELAFGETALPAAGTEREELVRGLAMRRLGRTSIYGYELIDEQGRTSALQGMASDVYEAVTSDIEDSNTKGRALAAEMQAIRKELQANGKATVEAIREGNRDRRQQLNKPPAPALETSER